MVYNRFILAISHSDYLTKLGGTEKLIQAEESLLKEEKISYIQIYPLKISTTDSSNQYIGVNIDSKPAGYFSVFQLITILNLLQHNHSIYHIATHIHHLLDFSFPAAEYLLDHCPSGEIRFYLHDYYSICPQFNLLFNDKNFCGVTLNSSLCNRCCWGKERAIHYHFFQKLFKNREITFISPSESAMEIWIKNFPEFSDRVVIYPHQIIKPRIEAQEHPKNKKIRIAFIGYQQLNKGWKVWKQLVKGIDHNYFECFHFGSAYKNINKVSLVPISFINDGHDSMIKSLKEYNIDIAFLWSIWPETYSFTFFESLAAGCFIVTHKTSGNIAVQVKKYSNGMVFDTELDLFNFLKNQNQVAMVLTDFHKNRSTCDMVFNSAIVTLTLALLKDKPWEPKSDILVDKLFQCPGDIEILKKLEDESNTVTGIFAVENKFKIWHSHLIKRPIVGWVAKLGFKLFEPFPGLRRRIKRNKLLQLFLKA
jgi:hypothetical protein